MHLFSTIKLFTRLEIRLCMETSCKPKTATLQHASLGVFLVSWQRSPAYQRWHGLKDPRDLASESSKDVSPFWLVSHRRPGI